MEILPAQAVRTLNVPTRPNSKLFTCQLVLVAAAPVLQDLGEKMGGPCPPPGSYGLETVRMWKAQSFKHSETFGNILKVQATFLYSIYHQRAGKTNLFHMRGGRLHAGNTLGTFKAAPCLKSPELEPSHINQPNIKCASEITEGEPIEFNVRMPRLAVRMARNKVQCRKLCSCYVTSHI